MSLAKKREKLMALLAKRVKKNDNKKDINGSSKRKILNAQTYKKMFKIAGQKAKVSQGGEADEMIVKSKRQRVVLDSEGVCFGDTRCTDESSHFSLSDDGDCGALLKMGECLDGFRGFKSQLKQFCAICMGVGELLLCSGRECGKSFHLSCLDPSLPYAPPGAWHCVFCTQKKIKFGPHSVSKGIESILDSRDMVLDDSGTVTLKQKEYMVKYQSLSHVHNKWIPETQLLREAPNLLSRLKRNFWTKWKAEWGVPHRVLKRRQLIYDDQDCGYEWLVKWTGLNYDHSTWELETASCFKTREAMILIENYETRSQKYAVSHLLEESGNAEFSEFQFEVPTELRNHVLPYVNKLWDYWRRGQNAVFFDGQDRLVKVVFFVLSLMGNVRQPVLILAASSVLSVWEAEFSKWSNATDVVTYKGNKNVRSVIRELEFYSENGSITFQVLLSSLDIIIEDLEMLEHIKWELVIVDECQRHTISTHCENIKMLVADMKLLTITGEIVDYKQSYHNILSLLDSKYGEGLDTRTFKERLSPYVAFECKLGTTEFDEYWVPVHLSPTQINQYCSILCSNLEPLSMCSRNSSSLHDILTLTQKCCDHPYLVDPTLRNSLKGDISSDPLDAEINVSGKLQLLDRMLSEIKRCGLQVVVLFQPVIGSEKISIGDILDDLVHRRFGQESYVRIEGKILSKDARAKKKQALNTFNVIENECFVCLLDYRACHSSIQLSHADVAVFFNSDWNVLNDIKALQKISIDSRYEQLRIFRLYSSFTIEEKTLILAKQGTFLDTNIGHINWTTCHQLLAWGASYLFSKLESDHDSKQLFFDHLIREFTSLLLNESGDLGPSKCSIILNTKQHEGVYPRNILLLGENSSSEEFLIENGSLFWNNLLKESSHKRKHLRLSRRLSQRVKKSFLNDMKTFENVIDDTVTSTSAKAKVRSKRNVSTEAKQSKLTGVFGHSGGEMVELSENVNGNCTSDDVSSENVLLGSTQVNQEMVNDNNGGWRMWPTPDQQVQLITPSSGNPTQRTNHSLMQPVEEQIIPSTHISDPIVWNPRNTNSIPEYPTNQPPQTPHETPPIFESSTATLLEIEIERIQKGLEMINDNNVGWRMWPTLDQLQPGTSSLDDLTDRSSCSLMQPVEEQIIPSTRIPIALNPRDANNSPKCTNNRSRAVTTPPLEIEMQRIQKDRDQATKLHQEKKLMLDSECEKEISEIRKKYDALIEESETCLMNEMKVLEEYYQLVYANKVLAKILALTYYDSEKVTSPVRIHQTPVPRPAPAGNPYSTNLSSIGFPTSHVCGPSLGLRAPAPHLRARPSFPSTHNLPTFLPTIPNPSLVDPIPLTAQSTPQTLPSESNNMIYQQVNLQHPNFR